MKYLYIEPEVAGGLGEKTIINTSVNPPNVSKLHYKFDGWLGDILLESYPCFIIAEGAKHELQLAGITGMEFDEVLITTSEQFHELYPNLQLPKFEWLQIMGKPGNDDFGIAQDGRLVISARALNVLSKLGVSHALITQY